jgi:hypothetical protein
MSDHGEHEGEAQAAQGVQSELKAEIVEPCPRGGQVSRQVARDFDLTETGVRQAGFDPATRCLEITIEESSPMPVVARRAVA